LLSGEAALAWAVILGLGVVAFGAQMFGLRASFTESETPVSGLE
jgi:hypothetical protein